MNEQRPARDPVSFEDYPLTRGEYISAIVHLYRGELTRANTWRIRLDTTTNWAIISVMGILSFVFSAPEHPHAAVILGMYLVLNFLVLEARRYRFFDVWKNRVRMIEENFYGPLLRRDLTSPEVQWGTLVAGDLLEPRFKISYLQALRTRLASNYVPLFGVLLAGWLAKAVLLPPAPAGPLLARLAAGPLPGWAPAFLVAALYAFLAGVLIFVKKVRTPLHELWSAGESEGALPDF